MRTVSTVVGFKEQGNQPLDSIQGY